MMPEHLKCAVQEAPQKSTARQRFGKYVPKVTLSTVDKHPLQGNRHVPAATDTKLTHFHGGGFLETNSKNTFQHKRRFNKSFSINEQATNISQGYCQTI
jgi:hypothetical protein